MRCVTVIEEDGDVSEYPRAYRDRKEGVIAAFSLGAMSTVNAKVEPVLYARLRDVWAQVEGLRDELRRYHNVNGFTPTWTVLSNMLDETCASLREED